MRIATSFLGRWLPAPTLILCLGIAWGQAPPPSTKPLQLQDVLIKEWKPATLEDMLSQALKSNADVRVAESKVREAEAELNRTRMQIMQKVVALRSAVDAQEGAIKEAELNVQVTQLKLRRLAQLEKNNAIDRSSVEEANAAVVAAEQKLVAAKAKLADLRTEVDFVQGRQAHVKFKVLVEAPLNYEEFELRTRPADPRYALLWMDKAVVGSPVDKLRKTLDTQVKVKSKQQSVDELLRGLQSAHGITFVLATKKLGETKVDLETEDMALGAVLEMVEDMVPGIHFAVRDYGVLVTAAERLPAGAVPLYTFWKAKTAGEAKDVKDALKVEIKRP